MGGGASPKKMFESVLSFSTGGAYDVSKGNAPLQSGVEGVKSLAGTTAPQVGAVPQVSGGDVAEAVKPVTADTKAVAGRRSRGLNRTQTVFTSTLGIGGIASTARKTLLGQ